MGVSAQAIFQGRENTMTVMRIRELRRRAGITQIQLAERMGVIQSTVASWESEVALPRARQLPLLAQALGCSIDELYNRDEKAC